MIRFLVAILLSSPRNWLRLLFNNKLALSEPVVFGKNHGTSAQMHFIWFSCQRDFQYLLKSIRSLQNLRFSKIGRIHIVCDKKSLFSKEEFLAISGASATPIYFYESAYPLSWGGVETIVSERNAFAEMSLFAAPNDWIVKVDSDIEFTSADLFLKIIESSSEIVGHPMRLVNKKWILNYFQGGCYFFRASSLSKIVKLPLFMTLLNTLWKFPYHTLNEFPEDVYFSSAGEEAGFKLKEIVYMMPLASQIKKDPNLFSNVELDSLSDKEDVLFSMIHYQGVKEEMI